MADEGSEAPTLVARSPVFQSIQSLFSTFTDRRASLGLSNPGSVENVAKEVQRDVFLTNSMFTGLRADITQAFSVTPIFQTSWAFSMGSQGLPPWNFLSLFGTSKARRPLPSRTFLQGTIDNEGQLGARANYRWNDALTTRSQTQLAPGGGQSMIQIENEYQGKDFTASIKALNPWALDGGLTGIFIGHYLQSITRALALGVEGIWQRQAMSSGPDSVVNYFAKYKGSDWVASAQLAQGAISTTYWRKIGEKVEAGAELNVQLQPAMGGRGGLMGGPMRREAIATLGAKYDFRASTFRAQVDSSGRLSTLLEKRVLPVVLLSFAGELDQFKQQAKVGVGVSVEISNEAVAEQQEKAVTLNMPQPPY